MKIAVLGLFLGLAVLAESQAPLVKNIHGWNTWQRPNSGGRFERIAPSDDFPQGAMKFLPDTDKGKYSIQWYRPFAIQTGARLRFVFTFKSAADTNPDTTVSLSMKGRTQAGDWCMQPLAERQMLPVVPGTVQELAIETNLQALRITDVAALSPIITVTNLKAGYITFTQVKGEPVKQ